MLSQWGICSFLLKKSKNCLFFKKKPKIFCQTKRRESSSKKRKTNFYGF